MADGDAHDGPPAQEVGTRVHGERDRLALVGWLRAADDAVLRALATDPTAQVAACPGWDVTALAGHLGAVQEMVTKLLAARAVERQPRSDPEPGDDPAGWFAGIAEALVREVAAIPLDAQVWTFSGVGPASFWVRRVAAEAAIHAWDAQDAVGGPEPLEPGLALAVVDEALTEWVPAFAARQEEGAPRRGSLHLHRTDGPGEWLVVDGPDGPVVTHEHAKGDAALRASASDLALFIWHRRDPAALELFGDPEVARSWALSV